MRLINAVLGLWLVTAPATFGYHSTPMAWSDHISGLLAIIFGLLSRRRPMWAWGTVVVGFWLQFAPLLFWAPDAAAYLNDTLIGALMLAFSIVIWGVPGVRDEGAHIPPGWSYNPSSYPQRMPIIALNFLCWFTARYLAAFELGYIDQIWDPVFGEGTRLVLTSTISKSFPVADAGMGALAYTLEALTGFGSTRRWHTEPWLVVFFGILVIPVSCTSIVLIILQPTIVGAWCFLCICTAIMMLLMVPFTIDEVVATLQFLRRAKKSGKSLWSTFWKGGEFEGGDADTRTPETTAPLSQLLPAARWGVSIPWNLGLSALGGVVGMFLGAFIPAALIVVFSVIAWAEVVRRVRFLIVPMAVWLAFSVPLLGVVVLILAFRRGPNRERYGTWTIR